MTSFTASVLCALLLLCALTDAAAPTCDDLIELEGFDCALDSEAGTVNVTEDGTLGDASDPGIPIYHITYWADGATVEDLIPIVVLHGGPGLSHDYVATIKYLACGGEYKVIFYDQGYTGRSKPAGATSTPSRYYEVAYYSLEAGVVISQLVGTAAYHLLGQSWGSFLALQFALDNPTANLITLILANGLPSAPLWVANVNNHLIQKMPTFYRDLLVQSTDPDVTSTDEYLDALNFFNNYCFFRLNPIPDCVLESFTTYYSNDVYYNMWGPNDFTFSPAATLKDWDVTDRVSEVEFTTLTFYGEFDEISIDGWNVLYSRLPNRKGARIPAASHLAHIDGIEAWFPLVQQWLADPVVDVNVGGNFSLTDDDCDDLSAASSVPHGSAVAAVAAAVAAVLVGLFQ